MDHVATTPRGANPSGRRTGFLQFWLFVPDVAAAENTLASWFNGGPGCSSFFGALFENSPATVPLRPAGWCCGEEDAPLEVSEWATTSVDVPDVSPCR